MLCVRKENRMRYAVDGKGKTALIATAAGIAAADQLIKRMISCFPEGALILDLVPLLTVVRTQNSGAAFSIMSGQTLFLLLLTSGMLVGVMGTALFFRTISPQARAALAVLAGGGIGNWLDRLFSGMVTDYIRLSFIEFPVFNLADICICVSVAYLIVLLLFNRFETDTGENHGTSH